MHALFRVALLVAHVILPPARDLYAVRNDDVELERLAIRLGPARLLTMVESEKAPRHRQVLLRGLGLSGSRHVDLAAQALLPLADLLSRSREPEVLAAGADAAGRLCRRLGHGPLDGDEVYEGDLPAAARALLRLAGDEDLPALVRAQLVQGAAALGRGLAPPEELAALARSRQAPVRQAALDSLGLLHAAGQEEPLRAIINEEDPELAGAAALTLCGVLPRGRELLPEPLVGRLRTLAEKKGPLQKKLAACLRRSAGHAARPDPKAGP